MLRRIHSNSAYLVHGRSPLSEINTDLTLAHWMPPGTVHTNNTLVTKGHFESGLVTHRTSVNILAHPLKSRTMRDRANSSATNKA